MNELDELLDGINVPEAILAEGVLESLTATDGSAHELPSPPPIDKSAIYEAQVSTITVGGDEDAAPVVKGGKKGKKAKGADAPTPGQASTTSRRKKAAKDKSTDDTPPAPTNPGVIVGRSEALAKRANVEDLKRLGFDDDEIAIVLHKMDNAPKKVSEKAFNLIRFALGRESLSNYTRSALLTLDDAGDAGLTTPQLVKTFETGGDYNVAYKSGTARSQAQQMHRLFNIYGMVTGAGAMQLAREHPFVKEALTRLRKAA